MKKAVPRYGVRNVSGSVELAFKALNEGRGVQGPDIRRFEERFAASHGTILEAVSENRGQTGEFLKKGTVSNF